MTHHQGRLAPEIICAEFETLAATLFDGVARLSPAPAGVNRPAFSERETEVLAYLKGVAEAEGLSTAYDAGCNLLISLPEHQDAEQYCLIGSHADSIDQGGNFDGLAGVIAGLLSLIAARRGLVRPFVTPVRVIAMRGEESAWFGPCYIGSKALLGRLTPEELAAAHKADGRPLADHMQSVGIDIEKVRAGTPLMRAEEILQYLEVHIEQGPVLVERGLPVAVVTGIRGNFRYKSIACFGESGHSGAVPKAYRHDPVLAMADLMAHLDAAWQEALDGGSDLVVTSGVVSTNGATHAMSRIPDAVHFSLDVRSDDVQVLERFHALLLSEIARIEAARKVRFELGDPLRTEPAALSGPLAQALAHAGKEAGLDPPLMVSGGGHDAAVFAGKGIPTGMIFVRNDHGSHNPDEAMEIGDLLCAVALLCHYLGKTAEFDKTEEIENRQEEASVFKDIPALVIENKVAVKAFGKAAHQAFRQAEAEPEKAAGYLLLGIVAADFADDNYETPMLHRAGEECLREMQGYAETLEKVYAEGSSEEKLAALSDIARAIAVRRNS